MRLAASCVAVLVMSAAAASPSQARPANRSAPPRFTLTNLGYLPGGRQSEAAAINDQGQIVGQGTTFKADFRRQDNHPMEAWVCAGKRLRRLGLPPESQQTFAVAINDSGRVGVTAERADQQGHLLAYVVRIERRRIKWIRLPEGHGRYPYGQMAAINSQGVAVGESPAISSTHAAVWRPTGHGYRIERSLVRLSHDSMLTAIDSAGDIAGTDYGPQYKYGHALVWLTGTRTAINLNCLTKPRGTGSCGNGIFATVNGLARTKRHDLIGVGQQSESANSVQLLPIRWTLDIRGGLPWRAKVLPLLPGYHGASAVAVNANGWIVGQMQTVVTGRGFSTRHARRMKASLSLGPAVLWIAGKVYDLNSLVARHSGWMLVQATAINRRGQVVGDGMFRGRETAFLLTPR